MIPISQAIIADAIQDYTYFHRQPELSFDENNTSSYIENVLKKENIPYEKVGKTGIIALIKGQNPSGTIALRADMDALPIMESETHALRSERPGVMHACGHDLHTACLLGATRHLNIHKNTLPVNVMLIFQHAEEVLPGGATDIIHHPAFSNNLPEWIVALHAEPELATGSVGLKEGQYMASGDEVYITLRGEGGHAALPHKTTDLVLVASHLIVALQQIPIRHASPLIPTVLTFGNIRCNSTMNVIPKEITLEGTFRTFDEGWRQDAKQLIRKISRSMAEGMGAQCEINIVDGYPSLYNDAVKTANAARSLKSLLGDDKVVQLERRMTTEDFARYSHIIPATFIRLGVNGGPQNCGRLHTPEFCPDLQAIQYGIKVLTHMASLTH